MEEKEVEITFEDWKKIRKERLENEKKSEEKKQEEERMKRKDETKTTRKKQKTSTSTNSIGEVEYDEEDSKIISEATSKGYCYFKRQLPTEERELIGDITPKAVTDSGPTPLPVAAAPQNATSVVGASSWNHAGTWEERDTTTLVKERFRSICESSTVSLSIGETATGGNDMQSALSDAMKAIDMTHSGSALGSESSLQSSLEAMKTAISAITARVTEVKSVNGEAQIVLTRGKKRHLYDFTIELKIEITVEEVPGVSESKPQTYKGSLEINDVTPGSGFEWELTFKKANIPERVRACAHKLKDDIFGKIQAFDTEYRAM